MKQSRFNFYNTFRLSLFLLFLIFCFSFSHHAVHAGGYNDVDKKNTIGCDGNFGPFAQAICNPGENGGGNAVGNSFNIVVSSVLGFITIISALYFFFQLVTAGLQWIGSNGEKGNIETARNKIIHSVVGLVIVVTAYVVAGLLGKFIGIDILNPGKSLNNINPFNSIK